MALCIALLAFSGCLDEPRSAAELKASYQSMDTSVTSSPEDTGVQPAKCNGADKIILLKRGFKDITKAFAYCVAGGHTSTGQEQTSCGTNTTCQQTCLSNMNLRLDCSTCALANSGCAASDSTCVNTCAPGKTKGSTTQKKLCAQCINLNCQPVMTPACWPKTL